MNIIVTGASRGLGYETVKALACSGVHRIFALSRNMKGLEKLKKECLEANPETEVVAIPMDLAHLFRKGHDFRSLFALYAEKYDVVIHNAGMLVNRPFSGFTWPDAEEMFTINFFAPVFFTRELLPLLNESSHVLSIGSMGGVQGSVKFPGLALYSASKGALAVWTECMAEEMKERRISFNCLAIGSVQTEMLEQAFPGYKAPLTASDLAGFVAWFALNGHRYFNGKVLPVSLSTP